MMIVQWFLEALSGVWGFLMGLIPTVAVPSWLTDSGGQFVQLLADVQGLGAWVPLSLGGIVMAAILASVVIGFTIKCGRIVLSFMTAGGGSAG